MEPNAKGEFRERSTGIKFFTILLVLIGGVAAGMGLAQLLVPDSDLAYALTTMMLPVSLFIGMYLWFGLALTSAIFYILKWLVTRRRGEQKRFRRPSPLVVPPGSVAFVPVSFVISTTIGLFAGLVSSRSSFFLTVMAYALIGFLYGTTLWQLAKRGFLPFPEPE